MINVKRRHKEHIPSLDEAAAAMTQALDVLAKWEAEAEAKSREAESLAAELAEQEARAGKEILDDAEWDNVTATLTSMAERLALLRAQQGLAVKTAAAAKDRVDPARRDLLRAGALSCKARAEELRKVVAARQAKTDQMLAALAEWEKTPFEPKGHRSSLGNVYPNQTLTQAVTGRADWLAKHGQGLVNLATSGTPDQVTAAARKSLPEVLDVERLALASVQTD